MFDVAGLVPYDISKTLNAVLWPQRFNKIIKTKREKDSNPA